LLTAGVDIGSGKLSFLPTRRSDGYEQLHQAIKREITRHNYKLIIAVEDIDRMDPDEIIHVLRIMRVSGDFSNTVFILPYDKAALLQQLEQKNLSSSYLEKFIQQEWYLPPIKPEILVRFIIDSMRDIWGERPPNSTPLSVEEIQEAVNDV